MKNKLIIFFISLSITLVFTGCGIASDMSVSVPAAKHLLEKSENHKHKGLALYFAARDNKVDVIKYLIEQGADINFQDSVSLQTPLYSTTYSMSRYDAFKYLVEQGANLDLQEIDGWTALHHAVWLDKNKMVTILVEKGADASIKDKKGRTAYDLAVVYDRSPQMINLLKEAKEKSIARNKLNKLKEDSKYLTLQKTVSEVLALYNQYPTNSEIFEFKEQKLKEYYNASVDKNDKKAINAFLEKYPNWKNNAVAKNDLTGTSNNNSYAKVATNKPTRPTVYTETELDKLLKKKNAKEDFTKWALIIGIDTYTRQTNVNYAANSAKSFATAAQNVLGIPKENIISLVNEQATSGNIKSNLELMNRLAEHGDTIYFYFAGHGVPGKDGQTYLLPTDMSADAIHMEKSLQLDKIYEKLNSSQAKKIYAFIDSCFSGKDDKGDLVYKGVAPVLKVKNKQFSSNKLTVMTAGKSDEFANQLESQRQRLFGYYLMKGLSKNFENIDKLYDYVRRSVKRASLKIGLGYMQVPQIYKGE